MRLAAKTSQAYAEGRPLLGGTRKFFWHVKSRFLARQIPIGVFATSLPSTPYNDFFPIDILDILGASPPEASRPKTKGNPMPAHPSASSLPILEVAAALGLPLEGRRTSCFNSHAHQGGHDDNPSLTFFPDHGRFKCFSCGIRGDAIDLVQAVQGSSFKEAVA
jgi:hypothetical protein